MQPFSFVGAPEYIFEDCLLHCSDIAREYFLEDLFHIVAETLEQGIWYEVERPLHPFLSELGNFFVSDGVWGVKVLQEPPGAQLYLLHQLP